MNVYKDTSICFTTEFFLPNGESIFSEIKYNGVDSNINEQKDTYLCKENVLFKRINGTLVELFKAESKSDNIKLIYSYYDQYYQSTRSYYIKLEPFSLEDMKVFKFEICGDNIFMHFITTEYFSFKHGFIRKKKNNFISSSEYNLFMKVNYYNKKTDTLYYKFNWKWQ